MEALETDCDFNEIDDNMLVQVFLNDTRVESQQVISKSQVVYTPEQLENIALFKNAIALNKETEEKYRKLEDSLVRMLSVVRKRLKENEEALLKQSRNPIEGGFNYLRCGKPYFKDKTNFLPPDNEDTIMMRQAHMYDFSNVSSVPGWTLKDKTELTYALLEMSKDIKKKTIRSKIARLKKEKCSLIEITKLEQELNQLHKKPLEQIALPLSEEYDWDGLANSLNRRHTATEYQALWKLFVHPSINKTSWTKHEHQQLQKIALNNNMQDWDCIAKELDTGRTGYQCFVYYRTNIVDNTMNRKWTSEEIEYLLRVVEYFREGTFIPWGKVTSAMDGRTKTQVYNKYTRMVERRKGRFLEEEDTVLLNCYHKYGNDFKKISEYLPGRSAVQLKTRYKLLTKFRLSTTWTVQDDRKLLQIMANLDSNSSFSVATKHFPGKDRTNIRSRYVTLMKWLKAHPATDISLAPRRGARRLLHGNNAVSLQDAIDNLNKRIQTEVNTKKRTKISLQSKEEDIEDAIMATLINEIIREESNKKPEYIEVEEEEDLTLPERAAAENTNNIRDLLIFFNAALDKIKFESSKYASKFPGLKEALPKDSLVTVKSYSKTRSVQTIEMDIFPEIWSKKTPLKRSSYVLPPNYATITGCRVLMKHFGVKPNDKPGEEINLSLMVRRNSILYDAMEILKERFVPLFMWPMMLSNEMPNPVKPYVSQPVEDKK